MPVPLDRLPWEAPGRVAGFSGLDAPARARLAALGIHPGEVVSRVRPTPLGDPVECLVGQQLLAVESSLLRRILVEPEPA